MPLELQIIRANEFIRAGAEGRPDMEASRAVLRELAAACRRRGIDRALLDVRNMQPGASRILSPDDLASLVNTFHAIGFTQEQRLAVLYSEDPYHGVRMFAFIGALHGWRVRAFEDFESAFQWLGKPTRPAKKNMRPIGCRSGLQDPMVHEKTRFQPKVPMSQFSPGKDDMLTQFNSAGGISKKKFASWYGEATSRRLWPLDAEVLCAAARRRAQFADFGDPAVESRLSVLVESLEREAELRPRGRLLAWFHLRGLLETRLRLERLWQESGSAERQLIKRPIFITGMPRSGSTFLHELLAQDPGHRAPLVWEVMSPLPVGTRRRIWSTEACLWWFRRMAPEADFVHPMRARTPHECVAIHSYTLLSREFITTFRASAYESFLNTTDFTPAYAWQKKFLQYLQLKCPPKQWVLKAPDHVYNLEAMMRVFPDAIVIQTHRDPLEVLESSSRLTEIVHRVFAYPQDRRELGLREARILAEGMERITRFREAHPELASRFLDVNYNELVSDPLDTVRALYRRLDLPLTSSTRERLGNLAANRSRYGRRRNRPTLLDFGINLESETRRFAPYCARFGIRATARSDA